LHMAVSRQFAPSVSTQLAALRRILYDAHVVSVTTDYSQDALDRVRKVNGSADESELYITYLHHRRAISHSSSMSRMSI
jgi:hypothetical protein